MVAYSRDNTGPLSHDVKTGTPSLQRHNLKTGLCYDILLKHIVHTCVLVKVVRKLETVIMYLTIGRFGRGHIITSIFCKNNLLCTLSSSLHNQSRLVYVLENHAHCVQVLT